MVFLPTAEAARSAQMAAATAAAQSCQQVFEEELAKSSPLGDLASLMPAYNTFKILHIYNILIVFRSDMDCVTWFGMVLVVCVV